VIEGPSFPVASHLATLDFDFGAHQGTWSLFLGESFNSKLIVGIPRKREKRMTQCDFMSSDFLDGDFHGILHF